MVKRLVVGFMVLAWYVSPMYIHPSAIALVTLHMCSILYVEAFNVHRKDFETKGHLVYRFALLTTLNLFAFPRFGILERGIMERSGFSAKEYPITFMVLYEKNSMICLTSLSVLFAIIVFRWRNRNLKYQLRKSFATVLCLVYVTGFCSFNGYSYIMGGRWWTYFAMLTVACNDSFAYFAGKLFGKHHLIALSPNKTVQGFIGGMLTNIAVTIFVTKIIMTKPFWLCAPNNFNYSFFEDY